MPMMTKVLCILLSLLLLYLALLLKRKCGSWLSPGGVWSLMWFLLTFIPLVAAPSVPANPLAILYIVAAALVFALPVLHTPWPDIWRAAHLDTPDLYRTKFLQVCYALVSIAALICVAINLSIQGVTLDRLSTDFLSVTNELIVDRYTESTVENVFSQLSNILTYCSAGLGGLVFFGVRRASSRFAVAVLTAAPPLALMTIAGAKGAIFLCMAIFYGALLAARIRTGRTDIVNRKGLVGLLLAVLILIPFVTVSFLARGLYGATTNADISAGLYRNFISYTSAHVYAFSDWFSWRIGQQSALSYAEDDIGVGFNTFYSIFKALGSTKVVPPGFYDEYYQYSWYLQSNIYTVFRGLILDFTIGGSLVFMYTAGLSANSFFIFLIKSPRASWSMSLYMLFCGLAYTSFIISLFVWNSSYPVFVVIGLVLVLNHSWAQSKSPRARSARSRRDARLPNHV